MIGCGGIGLNDYPIVFNTGQVILGWTALYRATGEERFLQAASRAADWLADAGYVVEAVEPPEVGGVTDLWAELAVEDTLRALMPGVEAHGDEGIKRAIGFWMQGASVDARGVLDALVERERLMRAWDLFMQEYPLVLMPSSGEQAFPVSLDTRSFEDYQRIWRAQRPQLLVPVLGLPAIAVPTGLHEDFPIGVQLIGQRYREDMCLDAAEIIEARAEMQGPVEIPR